MMVSFDSVAGTDGWFHENGSEYDVVLASRIRLSRNLAGHAFPHMLKTEEEQEIQSDILSAAASHGFTSALIGELPPLERRMLLERHFISRDFSLQANKACLLNSDQSVSGMVNEIDHLRISSFKGGLELKGCLELADSVDSELERTLDYAVSV